MEIGGHVFDLGAHCAARPTNSSALLEELGIEREDVSRDPLRHRGQRAGHGRCRLRAEFLRYHAGPRHLEGILDPGFERHEARFSAPLAKWAASEGIEQLVAARPLATPPRATATPPIARCRRSISSKHAETATFCMDPGTPPLLDAPGRVRQRLEAGGRRAARRALRRGDRGRARCRRRARARGRRDAPVRSPRGRRAAPRGLQLARAVSRRGRALPKIRLLDYATVIVSAVACRAMASSS